MYLDTDDRWPDDDELCTDPYGGVDGEEEFFTDAGGDEPEDLLFLGDDDD
jgi:hypothetical protein